MFARYRKLLISIATSLVLLLISLLAFQNCGRGFGSLATDGSGTPSLSSARFTMARIADQFGFSRDFTGPISKQGTGEARMSMDANSANARYATLRNWGAGYREYNMWWGELDSSGIKSTSSPQSCPAGYQLFPANEQERVSMGYHRFRCIGLAKLASWDDILTRDQNAGMQSGVVIYSTPAIYRNSGCLGMGSGPNAMRDGCVPRDDAMDDLEDFMNIVASRYNGSGQGKISHFIVWNENASPDWFDASPLIGKNDSSSAAYEARITKLADMMKRVHAALLRHQKNALMYVSTDQLWGANLAPAHMGTQRLLDGLWSRLGVNYSWSVAVHPYGDVDAPAPPNFYTFNNLEMISQYQARKLAERGIQDPSSYPQYRILASEQGWPITTALGASGAMGREKQARQVCLAHAKVMSMPNLVAVAHNYFHSVEPAENQQNGTSGQGSFFGLIPVTIPDTLDGAEYTPTGRAFMSTMNSGRWNQSNDHYCCQAYGLGCAGGNNSISGIPSVETTHQVIGTIDGVDTSSGNAVVRGWACARTMDTSIGVHLYVGGPSGSGQVAATGFANVASEEAVSGQCVANSRTLRFAIPLDVNIRSQHAGKKIFIHGLSPIGLANNLLAGSGAFTVPAASAMPLQNDTPTSLQKSPSVPPTPVPVPVPAPAPAPAPVSAPNTPANTDLTNYPRTTIYIFNYKGDYLMTPNAEEGRNAGYAGGATAFSGLQLSVSDSRLKTLYRCFANGHFLSVDPKCEGQKVEGPIAQLLRDPAPGTKPVIRYMHPVSGNHLATVTPSDAAGFIQEGVLGHAY